MSDRFCAEGASEGDPKDWTWGTVDAVGGRHLDDTLMGNTWCGQSALQRRIQSMWLGAELRV